MCLGIIHKSPLLLPLQHGNRSVLVRRYMYIQSNLDVSMHDKWFQ